MGTMLKPKSLDRTPAVPDSEIDVLDNELAQAIAAAMARRRAGKPSDADLRRIERLSKRRKFLLQRKTRVFA